MELLYTISLFLLFSSVLGNQLASRESIRQAWKTLQENNNYGMIGGTRANIRDYPFLASVSQAKDNVLIGGGAVLNKHWILCSAFETTCNYPQDVVVRVGSSRTNRGGQRLKVSKIIQHYDYVMGSYSNNVAVIKTATPIRLGKLVQPVNLTQTPPEVGAKVQVVGFGATTNKTSHVTDGYLQVATVEVKSQTECQKAHGQDTCFGDDTCFCADADNVGPCFDDFGDPLIQDKTLIGYFAGGDMCNTYESIDLYANVTKLRQWIFETIKQNSLGDEMEGIGDGAFYRAFE